MVLLMSNWFGQRGSGVVSENRLRIRVRNLNPSEPQKLSVKKADPILIRTDFT